MQSQLSDSQDVLVLKIRFLKILLDIWAFGLATVLCFFVMCYDFVIDIESTAIETWGALTFHDYCLLIIAIDCTVPETIFDSFLIIATSCRR